MVYLKQIAVKSTHDAHRTPPRAPKFDKSSYSTPPSINRQDPSSGNKSTPKSLVRLLTLPNTPSPVRTSGVKAPINRKKKSPKPAVMKIILTLSTGKTITFDEELFKLNHKTLIYYLKHLDSISLTNTDSYHEFAIKQFEYLNGLHSYFIDHSVDDHSKKTISSSMNLLAISQSKYKKYYHVFKHAYSKLVFDQLIAHTHVLLQYRDSHCPGITRGLDVLHHISSRNIHILETTLGELTPHEAMLVHLFDHSRYISSHATNAYNRITAKARNMEDVDIDDGTRCILNTELIQQIEDTDGPKIHTTRRNTSLISYTGMTFWRLQPLVNGKDIIPLTGNSRFGQSVLSQIYSSAFPDHYWVTLYDPTQPFRTLKPLVFDDLEIRTTAWVPHAPFEWTFNYSNGTQFKQKFSDTIFCGHDVKKGLALSMIAEWRRLAHSSPSFSTSIQTIIQNKEIWTLYRFFQYKMELKIPYKTDFTLKDGNSLFSHEESFAYSPNTGNKWPANLFSGPYKLLKSFPDSLTLIKQSAVIDNDAIASLIKSITLLDTFLNNAGNKKKFIGHTSQEDVDFIKDTWLPQIQELIEKTRSSTDSATPTKAKPKKRLPLTSIDPNS